MRGSNDWSDFDICLMAAGIGTQISAEDMVEEDYSSWQVYEISCSSWGASCAHGRLSRRGRACITRMKSDTAATTHTSLQPKGAPRADPNLFCSHVAPTATARSMMCSQGQAAGHPSITVVGLHAFSSWGNDKQSKRRFKRTQARTCVKSRCHNKRCYSHSPLWVRPHVQMDGALQTHIIRTPGARRRCP